MLRLFLIVFFIKIPCFGYAQKANKYAFDKTTFNQINSKKHKDGLYLSFNDLIQEKNSFGNQFQMSKSLDTIIFEDKYETYTIEFDEDYKLDSVLEKDLLKNEIENKDYFEDIDLVKKVKDKLKVFPLICYNDTFYYLIYHDFNKKEYCYAQIPKDNPFHTINLLIPVDLYNFYQGKNDKSKSISFILVWNFGIAGAMTAVIVSEIIQPKQSRQGFNHLKSNSSIRFDQWGSIVDNYILSTFVFSPVYGGIIEASYNRVNDILEQKPLLKAQIDSREMVDVGDGMQMPKYKYTRTTVFKLIDKLNEELLKD